MSRAFLFCALLAVSLLCALPCTAAVYTVTSSANTADGICDNDCTLRDALEVAVGSFSDDDIIVFSPGIFGSTITVASPLLIGGEGDLSIEGPGADKLTISGGGTSQIFRIEDAGAANFNVRIAGLKLVNGLGPSPGGSAIINASQANLELDRVHVHGNASPAPRDGAIYALGGGDTRIVNSLFTQNTALRGGAISVLSGQLTVINSTFFGNTASSDGGAIFVDPLADTVSSLTNVTITGNIGPGGGVTARTGTLKIANSVIAGNSNANFPDVRRRNTAIVISDGHNHIGDNTGDATATDLAIPWAGTDTLDVPTHLGTPQMNGGKFPSIVPGAGSPLIDTGSNALVPNGFTIDQRGYARFAGTVDKGAVEANSAPATATILGRVVSQTTRPIPGTYVTLSDAQGNRQNLFTSSMGYYIVSGLPAGESYIVEISMKRYTFFPISLV